MTKKEKSKKNILDFSYIAYTGISKVNYKSKSIRTAGTPLKKLEALIIA